MSALASISDWVEDEIELDCEQTVEQNFADINKIFLDDNRVPLDKILKDDLPDFMIFLADKQQLDCNEELDDLDSLLDRLLDQADKLLESTK